MTALRRMPGYTSIESRIQNAMMIATLFPARPLMLAGSNISPGRKARDTQGNKAPTTSAAANWNRFRVSIEVVAERTRSWRIAREYSHFGDFGYKEDGFRRSSRAPPRNR